jgi:uncharacterized protein (DUF1800 family)
MNEREKIAHLLRRFGLGAGLTELNIYEKLGVKGTIDRLIDYEKVEENFPVSPWEFTGYGNEGLIMTDPPKFSSWWALRMMMTQRPLQEKLTLFWHNHFAVSSEKVTDGVLMLEYQEILRKNANGNFKSLLREISKSSAMVFYLDTHQSTKQHPNENFAREVMELFTLGQGKYDERDIKEAARAFTGWGLHYAGIGGETDYEKLRDQLAREGRSVLSFCVVPSLHDEGVKTILGKTANFEGDAVLDHLCNQAECPKFITKKLAAWFIDGPISDALHNRLAEAFKASNFELKPVLRLIAESDEFWSESQVRKMPKSPPDYYAAIFRQIGLSGILLTLRGEVKDVYAPMKPEVRGSGDGLNFLMSREGFMLTYPPNVGGWNWGKAWITTANVTFRIQLPQILFRGEDTNRPIAMFVVNRLVNELKADTPEKIIDGMLAIFDGQVPSEKRALLIETCVKAGGTRALGDKETASNLITKVFGLLAATPEFQVV